MTDFSGPFLHGPRPRRWSGAGLATWAAASPASCATIMGATGTSPGAPSSSATTSPVSRRVGLPVQSKRETSCGRHEGDAQVNIKQETLSRPQPETSSAKPCTPRGLPPPAPPGPSTPPPSSASSESATAPTDSLGTHGSQERESPCTMHATD